MSKNLVAAAATFIALATTAGTATAQSSVTLYGRLDLSLAQQADAVKNRELRNGSGSRFGVRGIEDLGGGMRGFFQLEHRFNADTGAQTSTDRFWDGRSLVGLEGAFGRVWMGRDENPAYVYGQVGADPWGTDTVAANSTIINGRIGTTRYSNSVNYRYTAAGFSFAGQIAEAEGNTPQGPGGGLDDRPYSFGLGYNAGPLVLGFGYENPADAEDNWTSFHGSYNFGAFKVGGFFGSGRNTSDQRHRAYLVSATTALGPGEFRVSYGRLENRDLNAIADKQFGVGYHYALSKRTTLYTDFVAERRDGIEASGREKNGYNFGVKHNF
jgi:predicted porin